MRAVIQPLTGAVGSRCRPTLASWAGWRRCKAWHGDACKGQVGAGGSGSCAHSRHAAHLCTARECVPFGLPRGRRCHPASNAAAS